MEIRDLSTFLDYLGSVHKRTRRVIECIPPGDIDWSHAPNKFSLGDIVRHLAGIERWMYGETVQGRPSLYRSHGKELASGYHETIAYYDRLHQESKSIFASLSDEQLNGKCLTPAGTPITTWKWLRAMLEHEAHHRGQLYLMLGMRGVTTPPIYGLTSEEVAARAGR